jgi:hypothetical protein
MIKLRMDEKTSDTVYNVTCKPTKYGSGDQEIVVTIDGEPVVSIIVDVEGCTNTEAPAIHIFKKSATKVGFKTKVENL